MEKTEEIDKKDNMSFLSRHSFFIFIMIAIILAFGLVLLSMNLYNKSGAAQLDLSRPGYVSVRSQATNSDSSFQAYSSTGSISQKIIDEFQEIFSERATKAKAVDAFSSDPLSPESLWSFTSN